MSSVKKRLAVITSHPIQYNAPLFKLLAAVESISIKVFYTWGQTKAGLVYDPDFKKEFKWDIPLTDGYDHEFIENISKAPGAGHFSGIKNKELIQRVESFNPDAILIFGWSFHSHLRLIRFFSGKVKLIFRGDSTLLDEPSGFSFKKTARRLFLKWVYRHIDYALYTGAANRDYFEVHGLKKEQLFFAPHAVDNARYYDKDGLFFLKARNWREQLGYSDSNIVLLFAGKLDLKKAPDFLIESFMQCKNPQLRLLVTGNGVLEEQLKTKAATDKRISFLEFQNQQAMPALYRLADVYVLPSRGPGETWGLAVNEAMACGTTVILSDKVGCSKDLVEPLQTGYIFKSGSTNEFVGIIEGLGTREDLAAMGQKAKEKISDFNYAKFCSAVEKLIAL
jgi:glycosyltransferase involved in cell wall biosynthesis